MELDVGTEPPRILIKKVFESIFSNASITIKEDTYAAVYACSDKVRSLLFP